MLETEQPLCIKSQNSSPFVSNVPINKTLLITNLFLSVNIIKNFFSLNNHIIFNTLVYNYLISFINSSLTVSKCSSKNFFVLLKFLSNIASFIFRCKLKDSLP